MEWGEYRLGDLFESFNGDFDIKREHINNKGEYVITAGLTNNGILGKTDTDAKVFREKTITVDMFGVSFYRRFKYKMVTHARVFCLKPVFNISDKQGLFFANSLHFLNYKFGYENMCSWKKIKEEKIKLPSKNGEIDFDFMESFIAELEAHRIAELEAHRIAELEAYLQATGLKDYQLTNKEKQVLADFENGKFEWGEYRIKNLFKVNSYKKRFDANKVTISKCGYPYIVRTALNNGIKGYINEDECFLNEGNTISFGQDTATMFYQKIHYFTGDKIKIIKSKNNSFNETNAQFIISSMRKSFSSFSWGSSSYSVDIISSTKIKLPTKNEQPDYALMETLVAAIQKTVIKDVVLYASDKIKATKSVVKNKI